MNHAGYYMLQKTTPETIYKDVDEMFVTVVFRLMDSSPSFICSFDDRTINVNSILFGEGVLCRVKTTRSLQLQHYLFSVPVTLVIRDKTLVITNLEDE